MTRIIGLVLYWAAIVVSLVAAGIAGLCASGDSEDRYLIAGLVCIFGALVWLIGFGCRRALSDPPSRPS